MKPQEIIPVPVSVIILNMNILAPYSTWWDCETPNLDTIVFIVYKVYIAPHSHSLPKIKPPRNPLSKGGSYYW